MLFSLRASATANGGHEQMDLNRGIDNAVEVIVAELRKRSKPATARRANRAAARASLM
ncbi:MAG: hypothetical protein SFW67_09230 [Myxococcaceae bacterium]|nr:hypothetical protein [Myxococcaceae bacterium]